MTDPVVPPEPDARDPRPWEESGAVRRDVPPHRAELLRRMANVSLACGVAALVFGAPAVVGLPLAVAAFWMAERDLDRMGGGRLDPGGREETWKASRRAHHAIILCLAGPFACLAMWCAFLRIVYGFS